MAVSFPETDLKTDALRDFLEILTLPAAAVNAAGELICANSSFHEMSGELPKGLRHEGKPYSQRVRLGTGQYTVYVSPFPDKTISTAIFAPVREKSFTGIQVLCAAIRHGSAEISAAADDLYYDEDLLFENKDREFLTSRLSIIENSIRTMISECRVYETEDMLLAERGKSYPPVSVSAFVRKLAADLKAAFTEYPTEVRIDGNITAGLYSRINTEALKIVLLIFLSQAIEKSEYLANKVCLSLTRGEKDRMLLTLDCFFDRSVANKYDSHAVNRPSNDNFVGDLISSVEEGFDIRFSVSEDTRHRSITADIGCSETPSVDGVRAPIAEIGYASRYSDESVMLSRFSLIDHYK